MIHQKLTFLFTQWKNPPSGPSKYCMCITLTKSPKTLPDLFSEKDATFIERKTQTKGAAAYELFNHPGWFMCHDTSSKLGLVAKQLEIKSQEFLLGCLYMAVAQKPTKHDLKLADEKNESGETRESVRNISGIISDDVSAENIMQEHAGNQSNKTNGLNPSSKADITAKKDEVASKVSSNSTAGKNNSSVQILEHELDSILVKNSTKENTDFKSTDKLLHANVTENWNVTNVTNVTQKPKIDLQNKTSLLATNQEKQLLRINQKKIENLVSNILINSSKLAGKANEENHVATQEQANPNVESAEKGTAVAKQIAQALGQRIPSVAAQINPQYKGDTLPLQNNQKVLPAPFAPNQAANANLNMQPNQLAVHLQFPNEKHYANGTLADGKTPSTASSQLAKITAQATAAAMGFIHNPRLQHTLKYPKAGANFPFHQQHLQRQQNRGFPRPIAYVNQKMRPQALFRNPQNYIYAPAPIAPRRPLINPFAVKGPNSQFAYQQFKTTAPQQLFNNRYRYQYPRKGWSGLVSVGKQSLVGNSANFHGSVQNKPKVLEKSNAKLGDEMPTKISEEKGKKII